MVKGFLFWGLGGGGWEGVEVVEVFQSESIVSTELTMNQQAASHPCMNKWCEISHAGSILEGLHFRRCVIKPLWCCCLYTAYINTKMFLEAAHAFLYLSSHCFQCFLLSLFHNCDLTCLLVFPSCVISRWIPASSPPSNRSITDVL